MDFIEVGCAIVRRKGKLLIAQRKPGDSFAGFWEFPGGKQKPDETMKQCLEREVAEELGIEIIPRLILRRTKHVYPQKKVALTFCLCDWVCREPYRRDCLDFRWIFPEELRRYRFPKGDEAVINELIRFKAGYF